MEDPTYVCRIHIDRQVLGMKGFHTHTHTYTLYTHTNTHTHTYTHTHTFTITLGSCVLRDYIVKYREVLAILGGKTRITEKLRGEMFCSRMK